MKYVPLIMLVLALSTSGQQKSEGSPVDEFGEVCSEDLMARMDNFFIQLNNNPSAAGVVIFHGRKDAEGRNLKLARYISQVYPNRPGGFGSARLKLIRGENRDEQLISFWLVPTGANDPTPDQPYKANAYTETTLFDRSPIGFHRWHGALDIYEDGFYDLGCNFSPNRGVFARILKENKNLGAFLIVYTESKTPRKGLKLASFALNDLVNNFGVSRPRVRAIYGGTRKAAEIEFWLVPKGQNNPQARPNLPPIRNF